LEIAAILCEIKPGDEIIMPSFTFVSTANAFVLRGGIPVFVDIRSDTLNIDETKITAAITENTKAILPVHYAGTPCAMNEICDIAHSVNAWVVEDAAHGFLSKYHDHFLGTIGHLGCCSFHETKNIISGEGGALFINDERLIERAEIIRDKGTNRKKFLRGEIDKYTWIDIGSSYLPTELVGAFLYAQLEHSQSINKHRRILYGRYLKLLQPLEEYGKIRLPKGSTQFDTNGHIFYIIMNSYEEREQIIKYLNDNNITAVFHYIPLHSSPAGLRYGRISGELTNTTRTSRRLLRLPLYQDMTESQVKYITEKIYEFFRIYYHS
jgi:dTDP-4-amino-4,6-dideoxygalactose transaminase